MNLKSTPITILIADNQPVILHALRTVLANVFEFQLIGEAINGKELVDKSINLKPDIIITEISMPLIDGIQATKRLLMELPSTSIIAFTSIENDTVIIEMLKAGAKGYLLKYAMMEEVISAVHTVYKNGNYFSKEISNTITRMVAKGDYNSYKNSMPKLNEKEKTIIKLICDEFCTKQIADKLGITKRAVDGLRDGILRKINAKNTAGLVVYAVKNRII